MEEWACVGWIMNYRDRAIETPSIIIDKSTEIRMQGTVTFKIENGTNAVLSIDPE